MKAVDPIPSKLRKRPRSSQGFPVPYVALIHDDGTPDFRTIDAAKVARCFHFRLCALCGQQIIGDIWFIGGPRCAEHGYFADPAMHLSCAEFALRTCPHLAHSDVAYSNKPLKQGEGMTLAILPVDSSRAGKTALCQSSGFVKVRHENLVLANLPWLSLVWYRNGELLSDA